MAATLELNADTTHEQIEAYVTEAVKGVEASREGDTSEDVKGDAQKIAEDRDQPTTERESGVEEVPEVVEDKSEDWLDDELKAEAAAYGIDEKELADFTSRDEFERALRFFDRKALEAGRKAERDEKGRFTAKTEEPKEGEPKSEDTKGRYEITLSKDIYDDGLVDELTKLRDHYETRLAVLETRFAESDAMARQQQFDAAVDAMGHADLFGKTGSEDAKELKRRQDLFQETDAMVTGILSQGRQVGSYETVVRRVARMVFAEELGKKDLKAKTRQIAKQSNNRLGGSATRAHDAVEPLRDEMRRRYKELEEAGSR